MGFPNICTFQLNVTSNVKMFGKEIVTHHFKDLRFEYSFTNAMNVLIGFKIWKIYGCNERRMFKMRLNLFILSSKSFSWEIPFASKRKWKFAIRQIWNVNIPSNLSFEKYSVFNFQISTIRYEMTNDKVALWNAGA